MLLDHERSKKNLAGVLLMEKLPLKLAHYNMKSHISVYILIRTLIISVCSGECVEYIFEGLHVKVWLKASQRLAIRNFLQKMKHGSLCTKETQVCVLTLHRTLSAVFTIHICELD